MRCYTKSLKSPFNSISARDGGPEITLRCESHSGPAAVLSRRVPCPMGAGEPQQAQRANSALKFSVHGREARFLRQHLKPLDEEVTRRKLGAATSRAALSATQRDDEDALTRATIPSCSDLESAANDRRKVVCCNRIRSVVHRTRFSLENGYCKSFNSKLRGDFLTGEIFDSRKELQMLTER